jgi:hypothetical protein
MICSYLIERKGYTVEQALDIFKVNRAPGIRFLLCTLQNEAWSILNIPLTGTCTLSMNSTCDT